MRRILSLAATAALLASLVVAGTASGAPPPPFTVSPTSLSFGDTPVDGLAYQTLTVTAGRKPVALDNPATTSSGSAFWDTQAGTCWQTFGSLGLLVPARTSCTIQVGFHPTTAGSFTDVMTVQACKRWQLTAGQIDCVSLDGSATVNLSGTGTALPDLTIASIAFTPGAQPNSYTVTIANSSTVTADVSGVGLQGYYDPDPAVWPGDTGACGTTINPNTTIPAGGQLAVLVPCSSAPATGHAHLNVKVDFGGILAEADETNNVGSVALPTAPPDLVVTAIEILGADASNPVNYNVTVQNVGAGPVDVESTIRVQGYYSVLPTLDADDRFACGNSFGFDPDFVLLPGDSVVVHVSCTVRPIAGENYVLAQVDQLGAVSESDETNNVGRQVLPEIDLSIAGITIDSLTATQIEYTVTILLSEVAGSPVVPVEMQGVRLLGSYSQYSNPACGAVQTTSLIVDDGETFALHVTCAELPAAGDVSLAVSIDTSNEIAEYDELNNSGSTPVVPCTFTPGTSGCIVLDNVAITDSSETATYTLSGHLRFTPTCQNGEVGCSYAYPNIVITGSGTFSVAGSQTASGTWTVPDPPNDRLNPSPYHFLDASGASTTCALAVVRQVTPNIPLFSSGGETGGGWLSVRADTAGTTSRVNGTFSTPTLPAGTFLNPSGSLSGVTIRC